MRISHVRKKLKLRQPVLCTKIDTQDPVVVDMIGPIGFDCVWICREHIPLDGDRLAHLIQTAGMNDLDTAVRVPKGVLGLQEYCQGIHTRFASLGFEFRPKV